MKKNRHRNRGQRVEHVVHARQVELDRQSAGRAIDAHTVEQHAPALGAHVLKDLNRQFRDNPVLAIPGYNAGPGRPRRSRLRPR